jgi:hypothetical protein
VNPDWRKDIGSVAELEAIKQEIADLPPDVKRAEMSDQDPPPPPPSA